MLTALLRRAGEDRLAFERFFDLAQGELHRLAVAIGRGNQHADALQATALVNEAVLRLLRVRPRTYQDRRHFFLMAARAMRSALVDDARRRCRGKRRAVREDVPLENIASVRGERPEELLDLDTALQRLRALDREAERVARLRFFGGLDVTEIAVVLGIPVRTTERRLRSARALLRLFLAHDGDAG